MSARSLCGTIRDMRLDRVDNLNQYLQKLQEVAAHTPGTAVNNEIVRVKEILRDVADLQAAKNVFLIDEIRFAKGVRP